MIADDPEPNSEAQVNLSQPLGYDDPRAWWRTLRVTLTVDEVIAGKEGSTVVFDWGVMGNSESGEDADAVAHGLMELGQIVVFLNPVGNPDQSWHRISNPVNGVLQVSSDGSLNMPFAPKDELLAADDYEKRFLGAVNTLQALRETAKKPTRVESD